MKTAAVAMGLAVFASYVIGSLWYLAIGKRWRSALGWADSGVPYRPKPAELATAFMAQVVMVVGLWIAIDLVKTSGAQAGASAGAMIWLGFVLPTLTTNVVFQRRRLALIWQDGGHWLLLLVVQGAVLGHFH